MSRMLLVWSLLFGLALVGADLYVERGNTGSPSGAGSPTATAPADSNGEVTVMDDGTPPPDNRF